ncbi:MAG: hypothetical protein KJZ65_05950 [Phycisphaerales bacterium]|nr:hypothetical protein [Phycisphaerales bacterium]
MPISLHPLFPDQPGTWLVGVGRDESVIARLRSEYAMVRAEGDRLAALFFDLMFERHPQFRSMFRTDWHQQRAQFMESLDLVMRFLDRPAEQARHLRALGERHRSYGVQSGHYPIVVGLLTEAMVTALGDRAQTGSRESWQEAFALVAEQMEPSNR